MKKTKENELEETGTCEVSSGLSAILDWVTKPQNDGNIHQIADRLEDVASMMQLPTSPFFVSISTISLAMATREMGERSARATLVEGDIRHEVVFRNEMERSTALERSVRYDLL
jgi:hypothetical protein